MNDILQKLRDAFEDDNEHFMAAFIEAIQHGDVESALELHGLYVRFLEPNHGSHESLIDKREGIRKRWKNEQK